MTIFKFRFQNLLSLRRSTRDQLSGELSEAQAEHRQVALRQAELKQELNDQRTRSRAHGAGLVDVDRLLRADRYDAVLRRQLHSVEEREQSLASEVERRLQDVVEADREVRVLEKLSERQRVYVNYQRARLEAIEMDEIASRRANREAA